MKHDIILKGYGAFMPTTPSKMLCLGTAESYGIEQLNIIPGAGWEELVIKATFHPASSEPVVVVVGENGGVIDVPPEATAKATAESSPGVIVFSGVADGTQRISANLAYTVIGHAPVEGKDSEPTTSQWEQLAAAYQRKVDKQQGAENAGKYLSIDGEGNVFTDEARLTDEAKLEIVEMVKHPEKLPNPKPIKFSGAASGEYDGSEEKTVNVARGNWHQNSKTAADYISGRTHWVDDVGEEVFPETELQITQYKSGAKEYVQSERIGLNAFETYIIGWNGVRYEVEARRLLTNQGVEGAACTIKNKEGETIGYIDDYFAMQSAYLDRPEHRGKIRVKDGSETVTFSIHKKQEGTYHPLDERFIPSGIARNSDIPEELPNPKAIKFTGAVTGSYDGSEEAIINIPKAPTVPEKLPNPSALTFEGAATGTYDGSAPVNVKIPVTPKIPERLPNPHILRFTGAVSGEYDGSSEVLIEIPEGGDLSDKATGVEYELKVDNGVLTYDVAGEYTEFTLTKDNRGDIGYTDSTTELNIPPTFIKDGTTYKVVGVDAEAFKGCSNLTGVTIPNTVTKIGGSAFSNTSISQIDIPNTLTYLGSGAFNNCKSLRSIIIPDSVKGTGSLVFAGCLNLNHARLGNGLTEIENNNFFKCSKLYSIVIPDSVTQIGKEAFKDCTELSTVYFEGSEEQWNKITIDSGNEALTNATVMFKYTEAVIIDEDELNNMLKEVLK